MQQSVDNVPLKIIFLNLIILNLKVWVVFICGGNKQCVQVVGLVYARQWALTRDLSKALSNPHLS